MLEDYEPFENAEEVWFWYCACQIARGDGLRTKCDYQGHQRICEVGDIEKIIKRMRRENWISNRHLRVMYRWGGLFTPPHYDRRAKYSEVRLWDEGIKSFESHLRIKGIIL